MKAMPPSRHVYLLGDLQVVDSGRALTIPKGHVLQLFAYLILHPGVAHDREILAELLWPEGSPERVRRRLSDVLYRLHTVLGEHWLSIDRHSIALALTEESLWTDVWRFEQRVAQDTAPALREAIELYRGELLPGLYVDWILARRTHLHERFLDALERLATHEEAAGCPREALHCWRCLLALDPLRETVCQGVMRCLAREGRIADALQEYSAFATHLNQELGISPSQDTRQLAERLQRELTLHAAPTSSAPPPFVGRVTERRWLLDRLDRAYRGHGGLVTLLGEPGIGKSRLLEELAGAADWRGWQVSWGHSQAYLHPPPYAPLAQALESLFSRPRVQQLQQLLRPHWLRALRPLFPGLAQEIPVDRDLAEPPRKGPPEMNQDLSMALVRLLKGLHQIAPHLLILEDVHWADPALWPVLAAVEPALQKIGVLLVLSARPQALRRQEAAWSQVLSWDRREASVLHLAGLTWDEVAELARHSHATTPPGSGTDPAGDKDAWVTYLHERGGGNPLAILTFLNPPGLLNAETLGLEDLTEQRLMHLSPEALRAVELAAILGQRFAYLDWHDTCIQAALPAQELPVWAGELEQARFLIPEDTLYRFVHDTLRAAVYARIPRPRRRTYHAAALRVLRNRAAEGPEVLLSHAEGAEDLPAIALHALEAGKRALAMASFAQAQAHFQRALDVLPPEQTIDRFQARYGQAQSLEALERWAELVEPLEELDCLAEKLGDGRRHAQVTLLWTGYLRAQGQLDAARDRTQTGLGHARRAQDPALEAAFLLALGRLENQRGRYEAARTHGERVQALYAQAQNRAGVAEALNFLAMVAHNTGQLQKRLTLHRRAAALYRRIGDLHGEVRTLTLLGGVYLELGRFTKAQENHERALALCRELGDRAEEGHNLSSLGGIAMRMGRVEQSLDCYRQALAISRPLGHRLRIGVDLNNLGSAYLSLRRFKEALTCLEECLEIAVEIGFRRLEGFAQYCRGQAFLRMGRLADAQAALEASLHVRRSLGEHLTAALTASDLAYVAARQGASQTAESALDQMLQSLAQLPDLPPPDVRIGLYVAGYWVRWIQGRTEEALEFLLQAQEAEDEQMAALELEERERFAQEIDNCQRLQEARERHIRRTTAQIARADAPTGRPLTPADRISVTWTLETPEDLRLASGPERRRNVLARLLVEAQAQGGAPTAADLAQALDVSRRTILRDMQTLVERGISFPARVAKEMP